MIIDTVPKTAAPRRFDYGKLAPGCWEMLRADARHSIFYCNSRFGNPDPFCCGIREDSNTIRKIVSRPSNPDCEIRSDIIMTPTITPPIIRLPLMPFVIRINRQLYPVLLSAFRDADRESLEYLSIQEHVPVLIFEATGRYVADIVIDNECRDIARHVLQISSIIENVTDQIAHEAFKMFGAQWPTTESFWYSNNLNTTLNGQTCH